MIPLKLQLKNFLSYGEHGEIINFEPYQLICLSGKNGHGKSALLDALTWAVWGQARKVGGVARSDEALIRLGQQEMSVIFEFDCNGQRYTIKRELSCYYGKSKTVLDFGLYDVQKNRLIPLTEKTVRLTQERIEQIVGLDFDTFVSSVCLRQGQSNEFSKKSAKERKDILAAILGLDRYEKLRRYVMDRAHVLLSEYNHLISVRDRLREELDQIKDHLQNIETVEQNYQNVLKKEQEYICKQKDLYINREAIFRQKEDLLLLDTQIATIKEKIQKYVHERSLRIVQRKNELDIKKAAIQPTLCALENQFKQYHVHYKKHESDEKLLLQELKKSEQIITQKEAHELQFQAARSLFEKRKDLYQRMIGYGNWVKQELERLKENDLINVQQAEVHCPLCESALGTEKQKFLIHKLTHQSHFYEHRYVRLSRFIKESKGKLRDEHASLEEMGQRTQEFIALGARLSNIKSSCEVVIQEKEQLTDILAKISAQKKELLAQEQCLENEQKEQEKLLLNELEKDPFYESLTCTMQDLNDKRAKLIEGKKIEQAQNYGAEELRITHELNQLQQEKTHLLQEKGRLEQIRIHYEKMNLEYKLNEEQATQKNGDIEEYKAIMTALGKDGIQALIIESVIPEIEYEANLLLSILSDQNAQIFIESLRDLKSGGTRETLDIKIADNAGIRPYELFSGGEAFRIDFALRIAISNLLVRRAGASLQTLIIDEGFGSQDEEGLQMIMDALYKIQDRFAKIIIVSHLPLLKEQFPVHFMIEKTASGSHIQVIEQG